VLRLAVGSIALAAALSAAPAYAAYPVSGRWTYDYSADKGPARECGPRHMEFRGERRFDTGGSVPDYRNVSVTRAGAQYRVVDEFFTGQIRGNVYYTLRPIDADHLELTLATGATILLRRCA
jgi:hypothetical protein